MSFKTICVFDSLDHLKDLSDCTLEICVQAKDGSFLKIYELDLEKFPFGNDLYLTLFKIGIRGQRSHSKEELVP